MRRVFSKLKSFKKGGAEVIHIPKTNNRGRSRTVAVLDIGTSKVVCFIAHISPEGDLQIKGIGHQLAKGIRAGIITDINEAETSIIAAVHAAEQMAGETIESVVVNLSSGGLQSRNVSVELAVSGEAVSERDIADILYEGRSSIYKPDIDIIHCIPVNYFLDEARCIKDPRGMFGDRLGCELHMITVPSSAVKNLGHCVARCHLNVEEYAVSSHAAALACLEPDEMELGVTLVDMGGGVTSFSVFAGGRNVYSDAVPIGGSHVTNDIARGLSTSLMHAERIKTLHGSAIATGSDSHIMLDIPQLGEQEDQDEGNLVPRSMLVGIIRPRLEEIFEMIRGKIESSGLEKITGRRVVLTGGASQLLGIRDLATQVLGKQVRIGKPRPVMGLAEAVSGPAFSCALGMLEYVAKPPLEDLLFEPRQPRLKLSARLERVMGWVRENF